MTLLQQARWRALLAVAAGCGYLLIFYAAFLILGMFLTQTGSSFRPAPAAMILSLAFFSLPTCMITVLTFHLLTKKAVGYGQTTETLCRHCRHILRGITQPRCPECGQHI